MTELPRIAGGREADIYAWPDGRVVRVLKNAGNAKALEREQVALAAMWSAGMPVPEPGELVAVQGRPGLILERLDGIDLLTSLEKTPWKASGVGRLTAETHISVLGVEAPGGLPRLRDGVARRLEHGEIPMVLRRRAQDELAALPGGDRICHGDFHAGNIIVTRAGPRVIDWAHASTGPPVADIAMTLVVLHAGALPDRTPAPLRMAARFVRTLLARAYEDRISAAMGSRDLLGRWTFVQAAARFSEAIPGEAPALHRIAGEALRRMEPGT